MSMGAVRDGNKKPAFQAPALRCMLEGKGTIKMRRERGVASLASQAGQAMTEYLVISGLITAMAIGVLNIMYGPLQNIMQRVTQCVIDASINQTSCQ
jgi:hypothetical protein